MKTSILGAKAEAVMDTMSISIPARITGRRPKESESGPGGNQGNGPSGEGGGRQLTRDRHRYIQVGCDFHQQGRQHENGVLGAKDGKRKHGVEPCLVYPLSARRCRLRCYAVAPIGESSTTAPIRPASWSAPTWGGRRRRRSPGASSRQCRRLCCERTGVRWRSLRQKQTCPAGRG